MRRMFVCSATVMTLAVVAGCTTESSTGSSADVAAAGLTPQQMQSYCAGEAAGEFNTRPDYVSANSALPSTGGGYVVTGTVDRGADGNPPFECEFDRSGRFISFRMI